MSSVLLQLFQGSAMCADVNSFLQPAVTGYYSPSSIMCPRIVQIDRDCVVPASICLQNQMYSPRMTSHNSLCRTQHTSRAVNLVVQITPQEDDGHSSMLVHSPYLNALTCAIAYSKYAAHEMHILQGCKSSMSREQMYCMLHSRRGIVVHIFSDNDDHPHLAQIHTVAYCMVSTLCAVV